MLPSHPTKAASAAPVQAIGYLEESDKWKDFGGKFDDIIIVIKNPGEIVLRSEQDRKHRGAQQHGEASRDIGGSSCSFGIPGT